MKSETTFVTSCEYLDINYTLERVRQTHYNYSLRLQDEDEDERERGREKEERSPESSVRLIKHRQTNCDTDQRVNIEH